MKETATINTFRFIVDGKQICAESFESGDVCEFFRTRNHGVTETCLFAMDRVLDRHGTDKLGFLVPGFWCPLKEKK